MTDDLPTRAVRRLLVVVGVGLLLLAGWGGLELIGWRWPKAGVGSIAFHGPLMVGGFLGTLLSLERAVALRRPWAYIAPLAAAGSGVALLLDSPAAGQALQFAAGIALVVVFMGIVRRQRSMFTIAMGLGAVAWVVATVLWVGRQHMVTVVSWWMGFLVLTIVGERLELSRFLPRRAGKEAVFASAAGLYAAGLLLSLKWPGLGWAVAGFGMIALAMWLVVYDLAMRTVRERGLTRYVAACLLSGYFWLLAGGGLILSALLLRVGPYPAGASWISAFITRGSLYDAILHSIFIGFVFSMIFGHAPIIFPSVLAARMDYRRRFYLHLTLLELSAMLRVLSDMAAIQWLREWAGLLSGLAILVFLAQTASSLHRAAKRRADTSVVGADAAVISACEVSTASQI